MNSISDNLCVNTIRFLSVDAINKAKSGHPGICLGAAPIIHTLFTRHLVIDPENPSWFNRDRFVMSAGHGSALLYSLLHLYHLWLLVLTFIIYLFIIVYLIALFSIIILVIILELVYNISDVYRKW